MFSKLIQGLVRFKHWTGTLLRGWLSRTLNLDRPGQMQHRYYLLSCQRFDEDGSLPPLHWRPCHPSTRKHFKADMSCANGHQVSLKSHLVLADGQVKPSVVCRASRCDFHEFVRLDGWTFGQVS